jgi:hypothetical protein
MKATKIHFMVVSNGGFGILCKTRVQYRDGGPSSYSSPYWDDVTCEHCKRIRDRVGAGGKVPYDLDRDLVMDGSKRPDEQEPMKKYPYVVKLGGHLFGFRRDIKGVCGGVMIPGPLSAYADRVVRLSDGKVLKER